VPTAPGTLVLAVVPNGVPAALEVARALHAPLVGVTVERDPEHGVVISVTLPPLDDAQRVVVVDDAVESGAAAMAIGQALCEETDATLVLAVPVCPVDAVTILLPPFDDVVAAVWPAVRQELSAHYATFAPVPIEDAHVMIGDYAAERDDRTAD